MTEKIATSPSPIGVAADTALLPTGPYGRLLTRFQTALSLVSFVTMVIAAAFAAVLLALALPFALLAQRIGGEPAPVARRGWVPVSA